MTKKQKTKDPEIKKINGRITISSCSGTQSGISIIIEDADSSFPIIWADLTFDEWGQVLGGRGHVPCTCRIFPSDRLGMKMEVKTKDIWVPDVWIETARNTTSGDQKRRFLIHSLVRTTRLKGWHPDVDCLTNPHNWVSRTEDQTKVHLVFRRWVKKKGSEHEST